MCKIETAQDAFRRASTHIYTHSEEKAGIGTQGERMLHAIIKTYITPDTTQHEVKIGRYIADVCMGDAIYEVQTRRFDRLGAKLSAFLPEYKVCIVYPIAVEKTVCWLDPTTGETTKGRRSPKKGKVQDALYEIFHITEYLSHPNLSVRLLLCDMQEYRTLTGYGKDKKRKAPRVERTPGALREDITLKETMDYASLLPQGLLQFTTKELQKAWGVYPSVAYRGVRVLSSLGIIQKVGKRGRENLYEVEEAYRGAI